MTREEEVAEFLRKKIIQSEAFLNRTKQYFIAAATLDKSGRLIAWGENHYGKTHPMMSKYNQRVSFPDSRKHNYLHAEITALVRSRKKVYTLVVVRVNLHKNFATSKPCPICQLALETEKIQNVYYINRVGDLVKAIDNS